MQTSDTPGMVFAYKGWTGIIMIQENLGGTSFTLTPSDGDSVYTVWSRLVYEMNRRWGSFDSTQSSGVYGFPVNGDFNAGRLCLTTDHSNSTFGFKIKASDNTASRMGLPTSFYPAGVGDFTRSFITTIYHQGVYPEDGVEINLNILSREGGTVTADGVYSQDTGLSGMSGTIVLHDNTIYKTSWYATHFSSADALVVSDSLLDVTNSLREHDLWAGGQFMGRFRVEGVKHKRSGMSALTNSNVTLSVVGVEHPFIHGL